ncbi:C1QL [Mytilus edulis]|uniref:C1QL n=1 Tax=Mytilus edulis TaxID=6550 RepID=A0A8S3TR15_MYTED|nr:C1QL [Mytilus edulis]
MKEECVKYQPKMIDQVISNNSRLCLCLWETSIFAALTPPFTLSGIDAVIKFDDVRVNRGGAYDPSTGVFTATVQGLYHFSCMILANHGAVVHYQLNKNEQPYILGYSHKGAAADSSTISAVIELTVGDRVFVKHRHTAASEVVFGAALTSFLDILYMSKPVVTS